MEGISIKDLPSNIDPAFILNDKNKLITREFVNNIFKKFDIPHKVIDINLYILAMTHQSYCITSYIPGIHGFHRTTELSSNCNRDVKNTVPIQFNSYQRLEFLGDSVLHAEISDYLYKRFYDQQEGFMTKLRTKLENTETFAFFSQKLKLGDYVLISRFMEEKNSRTNDIHILEDIFEAFIGGLYLDTKDDNHGTNYELCKKLIINLIENEIDMTSILATETNYKEMLLQYAHTKKMTDPVYGVERITGNDNKEYKMYVKLNNKIVGVGNGNSKKKGEQNAAAAALKSFKIIHDDSDDSDDEYTYE